MKGVVVYVAPGCGPCAALKGALDRAGIRYSLADAGSAEGATLARWRAKGWRAPVVAIDGAEMSGSPERIRAVIDAARRIG